MVFLLTKQKNQNKNLINRYNLKTKMKNSFIL